MFPLFDAAPSRWVMSWTAAMVLSVFSGTSGRRSTSLGAGVGVGGGVGADFVDFTPWYC